MRIGMLTSGGDCQGLNAALRGVAKTLYNELGDKVTIYGIRDGYLGLIEGDYHEMLPEDFSDILTVGGTILGTSRQPFKEMRKTIEDSEETKLDKMLRTVKKAGFDCLVILGGNGTHKTANLLSMKGVNVVTLPKTIDNDLYGTDHCPGYASAAKYIATSLMEVYQDAHVYDTGMICIVEIMGRHAGWLTAAAALATKYGAGPDLIYLPETDFDMDTFLADVERIYKETGSCMVAVSEGIHYADGSFVSEAKTSATDGFGHAQLGGLAALLASIVKEKTGAKVRGIELSLLQRCGAHLASETDIEEAVMAGRAAVENAVAGITDKMVAFERETVDGHYVCKTKLLPLTEVANFEKKIPLEWINDSHNGVKQEFIDYVLPLIQGEPKLPKEDSLPRFAKLKKVLAK